MKKTVKTMCPISCHPTMCGMEVTIENNQIMSIKGDKSHPDSQGFLCVRGCSTKEIIGNDKRLLHPLIRKTNRDAFFEITNDAAFDHIESILRSIEPEQFGIWLGHGDNATNYGTQQEQPFRKLFGFDH